MLKRGVKGRDPRSAVRGLESFMLKRGVRGRDPRSAVRGLVGVKIKSAWA